MGRTRRRNKQLVAARSGTRSFFPSLGWALTLALRLGHLAVPFLKPGHYWGTDASLALMQHGRRVELPDPTRLAEGQLVEDATFALPGIPASITLAIAWGVFTHLPITALEAALHSVAQRLPALRGMIVDRREEPIAKSIPVSTVFVDKNHRQQGIAARLIKLLEEQTIVDGHKRLYVSATESQSAVGFYISQGFIPTQDAHSELYALEPNDIHMIKILET